MDKDSRLLEQQPEGESFVRCSRLLTWCQGFGAFACRCCPCNWVEAPSWG